MSESTSTPRGDAEGTFVGGSFGDQDEDHPEAAERLFAAGAGPAAEAEDLGPSEGAAEDVEGTGGTGDVEGTGSTVPPGERNEPV